VLYKVQIFGNNPENIKILFTKQCRADRTACHSVQNLLSSRLLSKNTKLNIQNYKFCGCFIWVGRLITHIEGVTLAEGVREQGVEEHIRVQGSGEDYIMMRFTVRLTHSLTHSTQHSPSWEANRFSVSQESLRILRKAKVHYRVYKCPLPVSTRSVPFTILLPGDPF
jgi:hypothetical protein